MYELAKVLKFEGMNFYFTGIKNNNRVYKSLDELIQYTVLTAVADYDGALIGVVDESFRKGDDDDLIRYFDSVTGIEEN